MSRAARLGAVGAGTAFVAALTVYYIVSFLMVTPPGVAAAGSKPRVHLTLQTVASFGNAPHTDWVSYLVRSPDGKWVHSTVLRVPSYSTVTVTVYQFDTATGLRNPFWGQPHGTIGGTFNFYREGEGAGLRRWTPTGFSWPSTTPCCSEV